MLKLTGFPRQQWLRKRALVLPCAYSASLSNEDVWCQYLLLMLGGELKSSRIPIRCKIIWYLRNSLMPTSRLCAYPNAFGFGFTGYCWGKKPRCVIPSFHHWACSKIFPLFCIFCCSLTRHFWRGVLNTKLSEPFFFRYAAKMSIMNPLYST